MPTLEEELNKRAVADSLLSSQEQWLQVPPDDDVEPAVEDTTRDQPEKPRTLDDSDIGNAPPPPAKPEPLPPPKGAVASEAWTGKGSYWQPLTDPENQAPPPEPAPDTLDQVERAELVKMPDKLSPEAQAAVDRGELVTPETPSIVPRGTTEPAPGTLTQVEKAQPVTTPAPATLTQVERGDLVSVPPGTAPKAVGVAAPVATVPSPPVVKPAEPAPGATAPPPAQSTLKATGSTFVPVDPTTGKELPVPPAEKPATAVQPAAQYAQPDGNPYPERVQAVDGSDPAAFIAHHTSGRGTVDGVISTLKERHLGVEYVMDRDGKIYATGPAGSSQILPGWGPKGTGLNNQNTVGMEIIAKDDADVTDAQKKSFAQFIATRYPNTPIFGHGEVNPGHKETDEGMSTKNAALALRTSGGDQAAPVAQAVTDKNGLYQNEKPEDFVTGRSTTFSGPADIKSGQDSGIGAPKLGRLATSDVAGVAVPEWVLVNKFGNNPAAWRKARADVIGPDGRRLRLPIVDLGPGPDQDNAGVVVDMTPNASRFFGGDGNVAVKLVGNAGPDVNKNPTQWADEQDAIKHGFDSASLTPGATKISKALPYTYEPVDTKQATAAQQADIDRQTKIISDLRQNNPNAAGMTKVLSQKIPGVSDGVRQEVADNFKAEVTKEAQKFYNEPDPDKAYAKAMSNAGPIELASDFWHKVIAGAQGYQVIAAQAGPYGTAKNDINSFFGKAGITSETDQHAFLAKMAGMSHEDRAKAITAALPPTIPGVTPDLGPSTNPEYLSRAFDKLFDPKFKEQQDQEIARVKAEVAKNLQTDPRLKGTFAGDASSMIGQSVADMATMATPALWPVFAAKISSQIHDQVKEQHPDWSEEQIQKASTYGTLVATLGTVGAQHVFSAIAEPLLRGIEAPLTRALAKIGIGGIGTAGVTGGGQAAVNIATGQPIGAGVAQAAVTGGFMGAAGAAMHGPGEYVPKPGPEIPLEEHGPPASVGPPVAPVRELGYTPPESRTGPTIIAKGPHEVTGTDVLGPQTPEETMPWYKPGPIVTRAEERTAFSPQELQQAIEEARQKGTPEQVRQAMERLQPELDWQRQNVYLHQDEPLVEPAGGVKLTPEEKGPPAPEATGSDKFVSSIANKFVEPKIDAGQIGEVAPGQGYSTKDFIASGEKMSPEEVQQHINDFLQTNEGSKQQAAAIRMREAQLLSRSNQASKMAEANPDDAAAQAQAKQALNAVTAFHNGPLAALKNNWHAQGMFMQGEPEVDLSTLNGQKYNWTQDNNGKSPPESMDPVFKKSVAKVKQAVNDEAVAMKNYSDAIGKSKMKTMDDIAARDMIMKIMKVEPCTM
jgi:hypothetical protein